MTPVMQPVMVTQKKTSCPQNSTWRTSQGNQHTVRSRDDVFCHLSEVLLMYFTVGEHHLHIHAQIICQVSAQGSHQMFGTGSPRLASAILQLRVRFLRLAEYQATVVAKEAAARGAIESELSIYTGDTATDNEGGAQSETAQKRKEEEAIKSAQMSANFAVELIGKTLSDDTNLASWLQGDFKADKQWVPIWSTGTQSSLKPRVLRLDHFV
jgi:hypothetical protein